MPSSDDVAVSPIEPGVECEFINCESLLMLPKHVAFKDGSSRYVSSRQIKDFIQYITGRNGNNYMQFTGKDIGDLTVRNDIDVTPDGFVRIMSCGQGKFWRRDPGASWIWADCSNNNDPSDDVLFWPVKINDRKIALRCKANNLFCKRSKGNCLRASAAGTINEAHLEVEETVLSRSIHNVNFRLADARVQREIVEMYASHCIINNSPNVSDEELAFSYKKTRRSNWSSNVSLMFGVRTTIRAGIPSITQAGLEISGEISETIRWGEEEETLTEITRKNKVTVPPMATMKVKVTAIRGKFEIPFSYIQSDILTNGQQVSYQKEDGVYFGENYFEFQQSNEHNPIQY